LVFPRVTNSRPPGVATMKRDCEHVREGLSRFLDGDLPAGAATDVAAHLTTCVPCRHEHDALKAVRDGLRGATLPVPPERMAAAREALFTRLERDVTAGATARAPRKGGWASFTGWVARSQFGWQPALATVAAAGVLALLLTTSRGGQRMGEPEILLPGAAEMGEMYRLHDAHGGVWGASDPALHRDEAADAHATLAETL
jgi:hypothetical protein